MGIESINPTTGEKVRQFTPHSPSEIEVRLSRSAQAFRQWKHVSIADRANVLNRTAAILEREKDSLGRMLTMEMGKTLSSAIAEVEKCAVVCRYYAENGPSFLEPKDVGTNAARSFVQYKPLGTVLAVMPWNFPFWQVFRFAAPALMAGNVGLLKHASNVPQCALAIEDLFRRAGTSEGIFQTLLIESDQVESVIQDERVKAVTLTGSEGAGRAVASIAGREIKKTVLELGGSDPFIVLESADLPQTAKIAATARTINNGQSCIAAKRFIVVGKVYEEFERLFVDAMKSLKVGDPLLSETQVGPLATRKIQEEIQDQVNRAVKSGGRVLTGGNKVSGPGNFYEPTVIADLPSTSDVADEEFFGPVALIFRVRDVEEAIQLANQSSFGLGASVWTKDIQEQKLMIEQIESGSVFINAIVASHPGLPFGGIKRSGYGRELSELGMLEFMNIQSVWISE